MSNSLINLAYLLASILFIIGLKGLTSPKTASHGNLLSALGMLIAIVTTLIDQHIIGYGLIVMGLAVGTIIGIFLAVKVAMTSMPQLVAALNGFGGAASALVGGAALIEAQGTMAFTANFTISVILSAIIGAITLTGSLLAYIKLEEWFATGSVRFAFQKTINIILGLFVLGLSVWIVLDPPALVAFWLLMFVSLILGITLVLPIGGADMPVVIALLNSYSGIAAGATGFVLNNNVLIVAGALVGASGIILTQIMCKAMNRSLLNVMFGTFGQADTTTSSGDDIYAGRIKSTGPEEAAMLFDAAQSIIIVPGYGMAVAQAQHTISALAKALKAKGKDVLFAIHPVAGRMPGHMNVLLAEADVPYDDLKEMEIINSAFAQTDLVFIIGANDVVNPDARENSSSPIYGMPILDVDKAKTTIVVKRSLSPGFAGIANPLFANDNNLMLFGDAKKIVEDLLNEIKQL